MEQRYGVSNKDGLPMWVADMDFKPPACVQKALEDLTAHGIYGYYGDEREYKSSICWWLRKRHNWNIEASWVFTLNGLVNGTAVCIDAFTNPGDGVVLFSPIYHAFFRVLEAANRNIIECPLIKEDDRYIMDFDFYDKMMTGREKMLILSSPHNPGGRVWTKTELIEIGEFASRHNLIIVSDEIHQDLVYPDKKHIAFPVATDSVMDRLIVMNATTKTFNLAGCHTGNVIIPDFKLRATFQKRITALGLSPNSFGLCMAQAAYSQEGAAWVDSLVQYLNQNRKIFDQAIKKIPGLNSMPLEATYLAWVDFSGTNLSSENILERVEGRAKIAANYGVTFGKGGDKHLRFNFATPKPNLKVAVERLKEAFSDLQ